MTKEIVQIMIKDKQRDREYALDVIKIIATILIVFHHYQQVTGARFEGVNFDGGKFYYGYVVELFFIFSGYFMLSYVEEIAELKIQFKDFIGKRALRLLPLVAVGAVAYEIFLLIYQELYQSSWFDINVTLWGVVIASLGIQDGWVFANPCVNNPTWYISVLMLCCFFCINIYFKENRYFSILFVYIYDFDRSRDSNLWY